MATITATSSGGNYNVGGSWVGGVAPSSTDRIVIPTGSTITLTQNESCGDSPALATDFVLDVVGTGKIDLAGFSLTYKGSGRLGDGSTGNRVRVTGSAGSAFLLDGSATPGTVYKLQLGSAALAYNARCGISLTGNSVSMCQLKCIGGTAQLVGAELYRSQSLKLQWTTASGWGTATTNGITLDCNFTTGDTADLAGVEFSNCNFDATSLPVINVRSTNFLIQDCTFTNSLDSTGTGYRSLSLTGIASGSTGILRRCDFDKQVRLAGADGSALTVEKLVHRAGLWNQLAISPTTGINNILVYLDDVVNAAMGAAASCKLAGNWTNIYCLSDFTASSTAGNPHKLNIAGPAITFTLTNPICDYRGYKFNTDTGDMVDAFGLTVDAYVIRPLILPAVFTGDPSTPDASGAIWFGTATANKRLIVKHGTIYVPNNSSGLQFPHGVNNAANTGRCESTIFWCDTAPGSIYGIRFDYSVNADDVFALADGLQKNAFWNMATGNNLVGGVTTPLPGLSGLQFSAAPTLTNITLAAAPGFRDVTRNFWTWSRTVLGNSGTDAQVRDAAIAAIKSDWSKFSGSSDSLMDWVYAGYDFTNAALHGTAQDGGDIGIGVYIPPAVATGPLTTGLLGMAGHGRSRGLMTQFGSGEAVRMGVPR